MVAGAGAEAALATGALVGKGTAWWPCVAAAAAWASNAGAGAGTGADGLAPMSRRHTLSRSLSPAARTLASYAAEDALAADASSPAMDAPDALNTTMSYVLWVAAVTGLVVLTVFDDAKFGRQAAWLAAVMSCLGVTLRWRLGAVLNKPFKQFCSHMEASSSMGSRVSEVSHGSDSTWSWMPAGTLMANVVAVLLASGLRAVELKVGTSVGTKRLVLVAMQTGLCGALSTMATVALEVTQLLRVGQPNKAYGYLWLSLGTTVLAAVVLYAVPVWIADLPQ